MFQKNKQNDKERESTSSAEQRTSCSSPIDSTPCHDSNDKRRNPPLLLPRSHKDNLPVIDIHERTVPPLPFEQGSESYTKKNMDAISNFDVRRKEFIFRDQHHHSKKQKSPISSIGYKAVKQSKYLFCPI